jgi:solute carrier family 15 (oligopeptide transporter), member 1
VMPATLKMLIGFLLTAVCMGVMAVAAYQVGDPVPAVKLAAGNVELLLPAATKTNDRGKTEADIAAVPVGEEGKTATIRLGEGTVKVTSTDAVTKDGKVTFKTGEVTFADGRVLHLENGGINWEKSRELLKGDKLVFEGALEGTIKANKKIQLSDGVVETGLGNKLTFNPGMQLPKFESKSTDEPSVSVSGGEYLELGKRVSVWWMALAFFVITIAEVLISVTGLELAFVVAPPSMKGFITACWLLTVAIANWFINAPIAGLYPAMHPGNYFLLLAGAGLLVAVLFIPVSMKFNRAMAEANAKKAAEEGKTEAV